jgi:hypothetical protein
MQVVLYILATCILVSPVGRNSWGFPPQPVVSPPIIVFIILFSLFVVCVYIRSLSLALFFVGRRGVEPRCAMPQPLNGISALPFLFYALRMAGL